MGKCKTFVYSRITGFYQPLMTWNPGKVSEWNDRKKFDKAFKTGNGEVGRRSNGDEYK